MVHFYGRPGLLAAGLLLTGLAATACSSSHSPATSADDAAGTPGTPGTVTAGGTPGTVTAGGPPADPCSVLTDEQVSKAMGGTAELLAEGPSKEEKWGCVWGARRSYVAIRQVADDAFARTTAGPDLKVEPVAGIGDSAVLVSYKEDGRMPELVFTVGAVHYAIEATADRSDAGPANAPKEAAAEQELARLVVPRLR
ncbi:hypothetical protein ACIQF6_20470 [Kitasatospora sp. NPDC092948]|uniref:hypothetical protein n=1 Tax=Kitasatospora sp. NPDC092948 TaxID=3364088 RepID=UPI00380F16CD